MNPSIREQILAIAESLQATPYGLPPGPGQLDCSLFALTVYERAGLPFGASVRTAQQIRSACIPVQWEQVQPGDLIFQEHTYEPPEPPGPDGHIASHVMISLGAGTGEAWSAQDPPGFVWLNDQLHGSWWSEKMLSAGRHPSLVSVATAPEAAKVVATLANVNLRTAPSTSADVLRVLPPGTLLSTNGEALDGDGTRWVNVVEGYVAEPYVRAVPFGGHLTAEPDHLFDLQTELWPVIDQASKNYGVDGRIVAAICRQESGGRNWRVHQDGTGTGLFGLDDSGGLIQFEQWSGMECGRGQGHVSIPPGLQIECTAMLMAQLAASYGDAWTAARVWHRGPGSYNDERGVSYESLIRGHVAALFGG
jgi:hypothetical protein